MRICRENDVKEEARMQDDEKLTGEFCASFSSRLIFSLQPSAFSLS
jgi:hypothetical protein